MATYRVYHTGDNTAGTSWATAYTSVSNAIARGGGLTTNDILIVDYRHVVTFAGTIGWLFPAGNYAVLSVDSDDSDALRTGATETVDTNANSFTVNFNTSGSSVYMYGMKLQGDDGVSGANDISLGNALTQSGFLHCESCTFVIRGTNALAQLAIGATTGTAGRGQDFLFENCTITPCNLATGTAIQLNTANSITFNNLTFSMPANHALEMMDVSSSGATSVGTVIFRNSDLSAFDQTASFLVDVANLQRGTIIFENCKISTATTVKTGTFPYGRGQVILRNTSHIDEENVLEVHNRWGILVDAASTIYADTGAKFNGDAISWDIQTTGDCNEFNPFIVPEIAKWNTSTTSTTFDIYLNSSVTLKKDSCWMTIGVEENTGFPNYNHYSTQSADPFRVVGDSLAAGGSWTGVANVDQKLTITKTPAEAGLMTATVYIAIASTTVYIDPIIRVS